jgi:AraC family transcriptional regulator of adaptative response / DNA-3-methyladenine glycosylase II
VRYALEDPTDLPEAEARVRRLLALDADPAPAVPGLKRDPLLDPLVTAAPGRRVPGTVDGAELAIRAVLGQQVSLRAAATLAGQLVTAHGVPLARPVGAVTHRFPAPAALAAADPAALAMPRARARALLGLAAALATGRLALTPGADGREVRAQLLALPGVGPWTAEYVALRALGEADAFLPSDLGVRHGLERLGADGHPTAAAARAEAWRPYRAWAMAHLWAAAA